jgi:hypothetical protein
MRSWVFACIAALVGFALIPATADAGQRRHRGWGEVQAVQHYGYYPRYAHFYRSDLRTDPYAYRWAPRPYYPYYNSAYWRPTWELQYRRACCRPVAALPPYYQAWGYPRPYYGYRARYKHHRRW